jgi:hypothetical protein
MVLSLPVLLPGTLVVSVVWGLWEGVIGCYELIRDIPFVWMGRTRDTGGAVLDAETLANLQKATAEMEKYRKKMGWRSRVHRLTINPELHEIIRRSSVATDGIIGHDRVLRGPLTAVSDLLHRR